MSELAEKVKKSVERLKAFEPKEGYYLAFSGGKDSVVCKALCDLAGVKYDAHYRVTSVDPPELVRFIKEKHPDVEREVPRYSDGSPITMWNLIVKKKYPPTRLARYCCQYLKEDGGDGRMTITGVRWAESVNRAKTHGVVDMRGGKTAEFASSGEFKSNNRGGFVLVNDNEDSRRMVEQCYTRHKACVNPIIDWKDEEVWEFIRTENIPYCGLYDCGLKRLGCIGCPMAGTRGREKEFAAYPKYRDAYLRAFGRMLEARKAAGKDDSATWGTPIDVFNWWMQYDLLPGQMSIEDFMEEVLE